MYTDFSAKIPAFASIDPSGSTVVNRDSCSWLMPTLAQAANLSVGRSAPLEARSRLGRLAECGQLYSGDPGGSLNAGNAQPTRNLVQLGQ